MGSNPTADNFASELWQFRLPRLAVSCGGDTKSRRSLLSGVYVRGSKISHQSALECVTVVDSTTHSNSPPPECDYAAEKRCPVLVILSEEEQEEMCRNLHLSVASAC